MAQILYNQGSGAFSPITADMVGALADETVPITKGGTGATTAAGARSSLGVEQSPLLVNERFHGTGHKYFLIAKSLLPTDDGACAGYVRVRADFGGWKAPTRTTVDVTVHLRSLEVSVAQCVQPESNESLLLVKQDPSGYVWVYLWMSEEHYYASVRVDGEQFERLGTWGDEPSGDIKWTSDMYQSYAWRKQLYAGVRVGRGLNFNDGILSVDNGAYASYTSARRRLFTGSVVTKVSSHSDTALVFTDEKFKSLFGRSININGGDFVGFFNGDAAYNDVHVEGSSYVSYDKCVYALLNKTRTNDLDLRINYLVVLV